MEQIQAVLHWQDINIEITYQPRWGNDSVGVSHLEVRSLNPERSPLPITETGYRSHFFYSDEIYSVEEIKGLVEDWLNKDTQQTTWKAYQHEQKNQHFTLF